MFEFITLERGGVDGVDKRVATLTLNRPEAMNAYHVAMKDEILTALDEVDADDSVAALVVTGAGRAFCAGMDLSNPEAFSRRDETEAERRRDSGGYIALRLYDLTKPVIGAINGAAVGVGVTMTLPMDIRLASTKAKFGFVFSRRGIVLETASSWFLPRLVGPQQAAEWAYTGRVFDAAEALRGGLVRSLHEPDELLPAAYALAEEIAANTAPVSVALNRQLLLRGLGYDHPMRSHIAESRAMYERGRSKDMDEGVASFLEKRSAVYPNTVPADLPDVFDDWDPPAFRI
ncbi:crotonase/enoyl-CoA hydratase family protein [Spongisporangium articulatum]|uniref:Crotonase/enoyl-CoA hydratase family protein n=1 Tax=Spongisporangium articulatum TaxID=3362603 RepID=A0ABW8AM49_9ACTN